MRAIFTFIFLVTFFSLFAQKMYETDVNACPLKFILEDQQQYINYKPNDSALVVDFLQNIEPKYLDKLVGIFMFQMMIDTINQVCCVSYTNKSRISDKKLDIVNRVNNLPGWQREAPGFENENICALYTIIIDKKNYTVQRTGYNRNKGRHLLSSNVYNRFVTLADTITADTVINKTLSE